MSMETTSFKYGIKNTFSNIRKFSFQEKKSPLMDEDKMNEFLDAIIDFKSYLNTKTNKIQEIVVTMEGLTWFDNNLDEECLMLLNDLIASAKDLRTSLVRQYVSMDTLRKKGIAKQEINAYKNAIDELKETYEDLESVFFFLPEMPQFKETTKQLALV